MSKKILIIEDDDIVRENTAELLELSGYQVDIAENGKIGIAKVQAFEPDLIICDVMMPELDGYGVLFMLSRNPKTRNIPFIFLTAKAERSDLRKGMELGADDYLTKPFEEFELFSAIEARLKKREFLNDSPQSVKIDDFYLQAKELGALAEDEVDHSNVSVQKGHFVYQDADPAHFLYFVEKGKLKTYRLNQDGKELVTALYNEGDFFGYHAILEDRNQNEYALALEKSDVRKIPKKEFQSLLYQNREVAGKFIKLLSNHISENEEKLLQLAYDSVRKKTASALLQLYAKFKETNQDNFEVSISRDHLASIAGTATESLIRALSDLKQAGFIQVKGKLITILDKNSLENLNW